MSEARLTAAEREAVIAAITDWRDNWRTVGDDDVCDTVEAILAARLAPVEALAAEWETPSNDGGPMGHDYFGSTSWDRAAKQLRAALSQPTAPEASA